MEEFKGTKGVRRVVHRKEWIDVLNYENERVTSFDKSDQRSVYDAYLDAAAPDLFEALQCGMETIELLLSSLPKEQVILVHELKSRKKQFEKAIQKALGK